MIEFFGVSGISIPEGEVRSVGCKGTLLWQAEAYREVEWISAAASVGAYIDLGFGPDVKKHLYKALDRCKARLK